MESYSHTMKTTVMEPVETTCMPLFNVPITDSGMTSPRNSRPTVLAAPTSTPRPEESPLGSILKTPPLTYKRSRASDNVPAQAGSNSYECPDLDVVKRLAFDDDESDDDFAVVEEEKPKKQSVAAEYLEYLLENRITSYQQQLEQPIHEWSKFATHPRLQAMQANYFDIVRCKTRIESFSDRFSPYDKNEQARMIRKRGERIEELLRVHHKLTDEQFKLFLRGLLLVVQMKAKKKNTFYIMGKSNCGKSQLLSTFAYSFFKNAIGCPSGNIRSGFPWNDCIMQRLILIEEPQMNLDNNEDYKKVMGGEMLRCDKKYAPSGEVPPTPVLMTSNLPLWHVVPAQSEAYRNRSFIFYFSEPIPEDSPLVPITKEDWCIILTKYWFKFKLNKIAQGYEPRD